MSCSGYYSDLGPSETSLSEKFRYRKTLNVDESCGEIDSCIDLNDGDDDHDDDDGDDSDWGEDEWPMDHPLPLPEWGCGRPDLQFPNEEQYQEFLKRTTVYLHECLDSLPYDTFTNFLAFSTKYVSSRDEYCNLKEFFRDYDTPLLPGCFTCVGLSLDLSSKLSQLERTYPGLKDAMYQVSCEEEVKNLEQYCTELPPAKTSLNEHVMLCIKVRISGRRGMTLFDPGYHVSQPITVMEDGESPQSGTIKASTTRPDIQRSYKYQYLERNSAIIGWTVEEKRPGQPTKVVLNRVHPNKPFLSGVDIAERRNLVYSFKSLLGRDEYGQLNCGLYFGIKECSKASITFFYRDDDKPHHQKVPLTYFLSDEGDEEIFEEAVRAVAMGVGRTARTLRDALKLLANLLSDMDFVQEVLSLDKDIKYLEL